MPLPSSLGRLVAARAGLTSLGGGVEAVEGRDSVAAHQLGLGAPEVGGIQISKVELKRKFRLVGGGIKEEI